MKMTELFQYDVTREIPPVVYFHEDSPEKLQAEVSEYIITGGWPEGHENRKRVERGIHEHYVRLLEQITKQLKSNGGPSLPASWISGFYGSGKSSFAKLLGLSLDGKALPDGSPLSEAWLRRNLSPLADDMREAWEGLLQEVDPLAVVFDIGGIARGDEHVHAAVVRQVQIRLGYCKTSSYVADHELRLERDGYYEDFLKHCRETLGTEWDQLRGEYLVEDKFSAVMHAQFPKLYPDPMDWLAARDGIRPDALSAADAVEAISDMMAQRASGKTLFIVVDEVSQYIFQDEGRMLKLQSLVNELGQRLKGKAWLFATGQQKLDDQNDANVLNKMKDRFPESLRVHLDATNIRDVVHRRLLQKKQEHISTLRALYTKHNANLRLFAYGCEELTESDFIDVYPMLPAQFDLILRVTSALRSRSSRTQGDDHNIRGLLQMLGELFRGQGLAERPVGELVTLDQVYEVQRTALEVDVSNTMIRVLKHCAEKDLKLAARCAKAVALLQLLTSDDGGECVDSRLVAKSIYADVSHGDNEPAVREALELLRKENFLGYSEKTGYKLQSSSGQDWERDREAIRVPIEERADFVREALVTLMGDMEKAKLKGVGFSWRAYFSTENSHHDDEFYGRREETPLTVDFRFLREEDQERVTWVNRSSESELRQRIVWVAGEYQSLIDQAKLLGQSRRMKARAEAKRASLQAEQRRLLADEEGRLERLEREFMDQVAQAFMAGTIYFAGGEADPSSYGAAFRPTLLAVGTARLPHIYSEFVPTRVTGSEIDQLLKKDLEGPAQKFFDGELGILETDAGRIVASCKGSVPRKILERVEQDQGLSGQSLLRIFAAPPFGHDANLVKACVAGLLRARKIRIRLQKGGDVTTVRDPGVQDLFQKDREFKNAEIYPAGEQRIKTKDRNRIAKLFDQTFDIHVEPEAEAIADRLGDALKPAREKLTEVERRLNRLPDRPETPEVLDNLYKAFEACLRDRGVEERVLATVKYIDVLRDGVGRLNAYSTELTDEAIDAVNRAHRIARDQLVQLVEVGELTPALQDHEHRIAEQLKREDPWVDIVGIDADLDAVLAAYRDARQARIDAQEKAADEVTVALKASPGFGGLDADQRHRVLRPITQAMRETSPDHTQPTLAALEAGMKERFDQAKDEALKVLDQIQSEETGDVVVRVNLEIRDRLITSASDVDALLSEIRERLLQALERDGTKVRLGIK